MSIRALHLDTITLPCTFAVSDKLGAQYRRRRTVFHPGAEPFRSGAQQVIADGSGKHIGRRTATATIRQQRSQCLWRGPASWHVSSGAKPSTGHRRLKRDRRRTFQRRKRKVGTLTADAAHGCRWRFRHRWHAQQQPADALSLPHQARTHDAGPHPARQSIQPSARGVAEDRHVERLIWIDKVRVQRTASFLTIAGKAGSAFVSSHAITTWWRTGVHEHRVALVIGLRNASTRCPRPPCRKPEVRAPWRDSSRPRRSIRATVRPPRCYVCSRRRTASTDPYRGFYRAFRQGCP